MLVLFIYYMRIDLPRSKFLTMEWNLVKICKL